MSFAGIFVDLFLIFWVVIQVVIYTKNGFVKSILRILQSIISFVAAVIFSPILGELLSDVLSINDIISNLLAFFIITIVCSSLFGLLINVIDKFFKLPVLNTLNKTLGFVFGLAISLFSLILICSIVTYILTLFEVSVEKIYDSSIVYRLISHLDIFSYLYSA